MGIKNERPGLRARPLDTLSIRNFFNTTEMDFVEDSRISKQQIRVKN